MISFSLLVSQKIDLAEKQVSEIISSKITKEHQEEILKRVGYIKDILDLRGKKTALFLLVQEVTNPLLEKVVQVPEIPVSDLSKKGDITTRYTYVGKGLYTEKHVFSNSKKDTFLTTIIPAEVELIPGKEYVLEGTSVPTKTGRYYFKINTITPTGKSTTPTEIYTYVGHDDKTIYFKNKNRGIFSLKVFYNLPDLSRRIQLGSNYIVISTKWKEYDTLSEIIETRELVNGELFTENLKYIEMIELSFKGHKSKGPEEELYWFQNLRTEPFFISTKASRDYSFNEKFYEDLEGYTKGEILTFRRIILREFSPEKYSIIATKESITE